jgi:hypothetical protein
VIVNGNCNSNIGRCMGRCNSMGRFKGRCNSMGIRVDVIVGRVRVDVIVWVGVSRCNSMGRCKVDVIVWVGVRVDVIVWVGVRVDVIVWVGVMVWVDEIVK